MKHTSLKMTDLERRRYSFRKFYDHLQAKGLEKVVFMDNLADALPPPSRAAYIAHAVPPEAYAGRMVGIALATLPKQATKVITPPLLSGEEQFWRDFARRLDIVFPELVDGLEHGDLENEKTFVYSFIGSERLYSKYGGRTFTPTAELNNKARMRLMLREAGEGENLTPGIEIIYGGDKDAHYKAIEVAVRKIVAEDKKVWLKHSNSISGTTTLRYHPNMFVGAKQRDVAKDLDALFADPRGIVPHDVVIEEHVDFGQDKDGYGDFCVRGAINPDGTYSAYVAGRQICNSKGEYAGVALAQCHNPRQLKAIGLQPEALNKALRIADKVARYAQVNGMQGAMGLDFFSSQKRSELPILMRDFNAREGGLTVGSLINSCSHVLWSGNLGTLDVELKLDSPARISDEHLEDLLAKVYKAGFIAYATTFLRYPQVDKKTNKHTYTLKVVTPYYEPIRSDQEVQAAIGNLTEKLNRALEGMELTFRTSLSEE